MRGPLCRLTQVVDITRAASSLREKALARALQGQDPGPEPGSRNPEHRMDPSPPRPPRLPHSGPSNVGKLAWYLGRAVRCHLGGQRIPLTSTLILTDHCNLHCRHCSVAHLGHSPNRFEDVQRDLRSLWDTGARMLVITGGEPFVWRDGPHDLEDVIRFGRALGFFRIVVCTNGTFPLESSADFLWVSLDGLSEEHTALRGEGVYDLVQSHLDQTIHPGIFVNLVVSPLNLDQLEASVEAILDLHAVRGILFHLFTPYLGSDPALALDAPARQRAVQALLRIKGRHPRAVSNSVAGLRALAHGRWGPRPLWSGVVINQGQQTPCCCRAGIADAQTCAACGCSPAAETWAIQTLRPSAILDYLKFL